MMISHFCGSTYIYRAVVCCDTMPKGHHNPPPEYFYIEIDIKLTCSVHFWILVYVLIIDILHEKQEQQLAKIKCFRVARTVLS